MVDCSTCLLMCSCPIVVFLDFFKMLLDNLFCEACPSLQELCLIALSRLAVVELKSAAWRNCDSYGLVVWDRKSFVAASECCVSRGTSPISFCLFLVPFIIPYTFIWTDISCLSSVMVHQSSYNNPNDISGAIFIYGEILIWLAFLLRPGIWSVFVCDEPIVLPYASLSIMSFEIWQGKLLWWLFMLSVYSHLSLLLIVYFY